MLHAALDATTTSNTTIASQSAVFAPRRDGRHVSLSPKLPFQFAGREAPQLNHSMRDAIHGAEKGDGARMWVHTRWIPLAETKY